MKKKANILNTQNILFLIVICVIFCGCEKINKEQKSVTQSNTNHKISSKSFGKVNTLSKASIQNDINIISITNKIEISDIRKRVAIFSDYLLLEKRTNTNNIDKNITQSISNAVINSDTRTALSICMNVVFSRKCRDWDGLLDVLHLLLLRDLDTMQKLMVNRLIVQTYFNAQKYENAISQVDKLSNDMVDIPKSQIIDLLIIKRNCYKAIGKYTDVINVAREMLRIAQENLTDLPKGRWLNNAKALIARSEGKEWKHLAPLEARRYEEKNQKRLEKQIETLQYINSRKENERKIIKEELIKIMNNELSNNKLAPWDKSDILNNWKSLINNIK